MTVRMPARHACPLCTETYDERTDLRVHLEVEHRKSEIVSHLVALQDDEPERDPVVDRDPTRTDDERQVPSAD